MRWPCMNTTDNRIVISLAKSSKVNNILISIGFDSSDPDFLIAAFIRRPHTADNECSPPRMREGGGRRRSLSSRRGDERFEVRGKTVCHNGKKTNDDGCVRKRHGKERQTVGLTSEQDDGRMNEW